MRKDKITIIGLGYVGLPLAVEFAKKYDVVGFDINEKRINELRKGKDTTLEVCENELKSVLNGNRNGLICTNESEYIKDSNIYIITVPTPIDKNNRPDLTPLLKASQTVGDVLKKDDIVIYESTVYPGATEEDCVPVLEKCSGLIFNKHFYCGYSPERINPGDKEHTVSKIRKVVSGSTNEIAAKINNLYKDVITAGTFVASSIKVAEAAKVIENSQRDINIAFVNELAMLFHKLNIDTLDVLEAAGTKWNFLPFKPGLVGGHCIGVDPYYLAQKAEQVGYHSEIILAGRRINNEMGSFIAKEFVKLLIKNNHSVNGAKVLVLGITFKENCPDIRNSRVVDIINELADFEIDVDVYDPWAQKEEVSKEFGIVLQPTLNLTQYKGVLLCVAHEEFLDLDLSQISDSTNCVIYDVKGIFDRSMIHKRL